MSHSHAVQGMLTFIIPDQLHSMLNSAVAQQALGSSLPSWLGLTGDYGYLVSGTLALPDSVI